ncbi:MAG: hypothetical protein IPG73_07315 [Ignavibacteria bacterium]|nr:hypothetical protein [Ignavibacteria bacterium]
MSSYQFRVTSSLCHFVVTLTCSIYSPKLSSERDAHAERFRILTGVAPVRQRVAEGVAWFPLRIREEKGYGFGEYPFVVVERTRQTGPHQLGGATLSALLAIRL